MYADAADTAETSIELLREFEQTGDAAVFELFMRRHASMVYATCLKVTRDPHDAEDATQATFLTLASKSRLNGEIRQPEAWLRKVAHRLSLDLIRSKKRRVNRENARSEMNNEALPLDSHDHADAGEVKGILNEELAKLPASYRMPLVLHYFGGLSREQMAAQLKLKPSTLGVRLHRAREQLRKRLAGRGVILPGAALSAMLATSVQYAISERLVAATAAQASAIVISHHASSMLSAGVVWSPSATMIQSITSVIARSKVKLVASVVVLGSALGATNAQVQKLLPASVREWIPTFTFPSLSVPRFEPAIPFPKLMAEAPTIPVAEPAKPTLVATSFAARPLPPLAPRVATGSTSTAKTSGPGGLVDATLTPITPAWAKAAPFAMARVDVGAIPRPLADRARGTSGTSAVAAAAPRMLAGASIASSEAPAGRSAADRDAAAWGGVLSDRTSTAHAGPAAPSFGDGDAGDAPEELVAPVVGTSPLGGGGGGGGGSLSGATDSGKTVLPQKSSTAISNRTQTVVFAGTSANYGGYADDAWKSSPVLDLSDVIQAASPIVAGPVLPTTGGLSMNGARVTLHGVSEDATATVSFLDTGSTAYPTLPTGHHFIGAWSLETSEAFSSADLLVRYDDLRAARMSLSEQILKLWVSDGKTWTLLWHDPTFGRDINQNLIWVTAAGGFKYFAVSAPEPGAMLVVTLVAAGLATRRRRR